MKYQLGYQYNTSSSVGPRPPAGYDMWLYGDTSDGVDVAENVNIYDSFTYVNSNCAAFNGTDDYILTTTPINITTIGVLEVTFSTTVGADQCLISKGGAAPNGYILGIWAAGRVYFRNKGGTIATDPGTIVTGTIYTARVEIDSGESRLYLDGLLIDTIADTCGANAFDTGIGRIEQSTPADYLNGKLYEVYATDGSDKCHYTFAEGYLPNAGIVYDKSEAKNDGNIFASTSLDLASTGDGPAWNIKNGFNISGSAKVPAEQPPGYRLPADPFFENWTGGLPDSWYRSKDIPDCTISEDVNGIRLQLDRQSGGRVYVWATNTQKDPSHDPNNARFIPGRTYAYRIDVYSIATGNIYFMSGGSQQFSGLITTPGLYAGTFVCTVPPLINPDGVPTISYGTTWPLDCVVRSFEVWEVGVDPRDAVDVLGTPLTYKKGFVHNGAESDIVAPADFIDVDGFWRTGGGLQDKTYADLVGQETGDLKTTRTSVTNAGNVKDILYYPTAPVGDELTKLNAFIASRN